MDATIELLDVMSEWHYKKWKEQESKIEKDALDLKNGYFVRLFEIYDYDLYCHFCFAHYVWPVDEKDFKGGSWGVSIEKGSNEIVRYGE